MATVSGSVEVGATAEETWDAAVDWDRQGRWVLASTVRVTSGDGRGAGATLQASTGLGPLSLRDPLEIVEWDPPHRVVLRHVGPFVRGDATYQVDRLPGERARLVWTEDLEAPGPILRGAYALGVPLFGVMIRLSLRRFARWAPRRQPLEG